MNKKLYAALATVVVVAGVGLAAVKLDSHPTQQPTQNSTTQQPTPAKTKITYSQDGKTVDYDGEANKTALETLKSLTATTTQSTSYGEMVTGINGLSANASAEYWSFYVNGQMASEGAGTYKAKTGDKIEWRLEKL